MTISAMAAGQQAADRGALLIRAGNDTIVVDRFIREPNTLTGRVEIKGGTRIDYIAHLSADEQVTSLIMAVTAAGAATPTRIKLTMHGDSVAAETPAGVQKVPTKAGAIPMFNNALAMTEIFTRRAKATGGIATIPYFVTAGGSTIDVTVRPAGADSLTVTIEKQVHHLAVDARGRILSGTIEGTPYVIEREGPQAAADLHVAISDSEIAPPRDYSAPPDAPYTAEEVRITGPGGIVLGGTLTKPKGAKGPVPAIVTITGSGLQDRDEYIPFAGGVRLFRQVADTLGRRGIAVLRLDDRGLGASGGDAANATSADLADDIRSALSYLRTRHDIDGHRLGLVGHSEGGAIGPMIAATDPDLKALVTMAGPGEPAIEISMAQNKYIVDHDSTLTPQARDEALAAARAALDPAKQTIPWVKFWMAYDPAPVNRKIKTPTLVLQGATDRQVPVDNAEKLAASIRAGGNADVTVKIYSNTNHLFIEDPDGNFNNYDKLPTNLVRNDVLGALADWLVVKLKP